MAEVSDILRTEGACAAFDALPTPLAVIDSALNILWANVALARLLGADRDGLTGDSLTQAITSEPDRHQYRTPSAHRPARDHPGP